MFEDLFSWHIDALFFLRAPQSGHRKDLSLPPGKDGGTVGARQHRDLRPDGTDLLRPAAVDTEPFLEEAGTQKFFLVFLKIFLYLPFPPERFFAKLSKEGPKDLFPLLVALHLTGGGDDLFKPGPGQFPHLGL